MITISHTFQCKMKIFKISDHLSKKSDNGVCPGGNKTTPPFTYSLWNYCDLGVITIFIKDLSKNYYCAEKPTAFITLHLYYKVCRLKSSL